MIKRNARLCTLATVLFIGSNMNASTFICPKDNTMIAKQAEITGKYKSQRPAKKDRLFTSQAVEAEILRVKNLLTNSKLAWMFENCFPQHIGNNRTLSHHRWQTGYFCLYRRHPCHVAS